VADSTTPTREEPIRDAWRWAAFAGLTWFGAFIVGAVVLQGEPPAYDKPIPEVRDFFARDGQRYLVGDYIVNIAFVFFFLPLVVGLRSRLGAAEDGAQIGSRLVLVGGLLTVAVGGVATSFLDAVALGSGGSQLEDPTIRALLYANAVAIAALGMPAALLTVSAAVVIWRTGALWRWLAPLGVIAGILLVVGASFPIAQDATGPLFTIRFVGFIAFALFVVATSLSLGLAHGRRGQRRN
jgi:hypothetical protein